MRFTLRIYVPIAALFIGACEGKTGASALDEKEGVESQFTEQIEGQAATGEEQKQSTQDSEALLRRGRIIFGRCRACHTLGQEERHGVGPNLYGLFGSKAGKRGGFAYSKALKASDITWSKETLDSWVERPASFIPGNRMAFPGLSDSADRRALIEYLEKETSK